MECDSKYIMGRLGYNSENDRYGLLVSDLWEHDGFHCGEGLQVMVDDKWVDTCMEMAWEKTGRNGILSVHHTREIWNMYGRELRGKDK